MPHRSSMRIVLSRKGFDSGAGGVANPILPCGTPAVLPIPGGREPHRYRDVTAAGRSAASIVEDLTSGRVKGKHLCHLDPDLEADACRRDYPFRAAFGQTGAAARHLINQGVSEGDIFLFFGWFRETEEKDGRLRFKPKAPDIHAIYGWMQAGEILRGEALAQAVNSDPGLACHPHALPGRMANPLNTIVVAPPKLNLFGTETDLPGAGTFKSVVPARVLSAGGQTRTWWSLPAFFHPRTGSRLSYHEDLTRWIRTERGSVLRSAARGQEFVLHTKRKRELGLWLRRIFELP